MDVRTITEDPVSAKAKLKAYRTQLHRRADDEYQAIADGYRQLAAGRDLINLADVMREAGCDEQGRPHLAIARADRRQVEFVPDWRGDRGAFDARETGRASETLNIWVDLEPFTHRRRGYALVPLVPADVIEAAGGRVALKNHFVLWEVEEWSDRRLTARPDYDPYLLRHLGGHLYAVVGEWDLTELERAVMAGRRSA